ncbi:MAG: GNAT family N-acetyltransferase [Sphingobacteriales bacterium]|jgi:ribosomal protein S18 acetylase RimI-like enzyme
MEKTLLIRRVGPADVDAVVEIARKTFKETYEAYNHPDEILMYMDRALTKKVLEEELEADGSAWYMAFLDEVPVGFFKIRWDSEPKNLPGRKPLELQRIYVVQEYQGFSIGSALISRVKQYAREEGYDTVWLQVWQKNGKAIKFYQASGFVVYETARFLMGKEEQQDFLMRFDLFY